MCAYKSGEWFYGKSFMKKNNVHWVKNGVDVTRFQFDIEKRNAIRNELGINDDCFVLFHVGRLTAVKNQQKLLSVFADFVSTGVKTRLFIAGDGELKEELIRQSEQLGVADHVTFLGLRKDVNELYQAMDVMLLPSFHEGFPVTLVEAQASGLPCIVSDKVTRETDVVGITDYLSIDGDNKEWIECLSKIHSNPNPNRLNYSSLMQEARYDLDSVCSDFVSFISK
jgi:glycosyltransferase involved in cell wall biosynthesis